MVHFKPEPGIGGEKISDFGAVEIEDQSAPVGMLAQARIGMFVEGGAVKKA